MPHRKAKYGEKREEFTKWSKRKKKIYGFAKRGRQSGMPLKRWCVKLNLNQISIKELTYRAQINRKTFYLHYPNLEAVLTELKDEIADIFIRRQVSYANLQDIKDLIRLFFESAANMPLLHERLLCHPSYRSVWGRINEKVMHYRIQTNRGAFGLEEYKENLVFAYYGANSAILYRQWVLDGKKLPLEDLIQMATNLICEGISSMLPHTRTSGKKQ